MNRLKETDDFGNRMKSYEAVETFREFNPLLPVYARIDGRSFSRFTRDMARPFDDKMTDAMVNTTKYLVKETNARIGFTQSDEINLVWLSNNPNSDIFFSGKIQKMCSILASMATTKFMTEISEEYRNRLPHFDCRVINLPTKEEAANMILWRAMDAKKNAISMVAQHFFSHKQLQNKNQKDMLQMLQELGINIKERYPICFLQGSFIRRIAIEKMLSELELSFIPSYCRPTGPVIRHEMVVIEMPPFNEVKNRTEVIFDGSEPRLNEK